ncbi:MAG: arsenate reductase family protein [Deltaproteobacteria bacterium]|jgi:arsenate reductase|nr:arsenate reductase family protein [Deltaproteobacteria bacterium]
MLAFICYPKCETCKKAQAFLDETGKKYAIRDIKADKPNYEELKEWRAKSGLPAKKFFNTNGVIYKSNSLKDKVPNMTEDECLKLLATDGMLVKRPILVDGKGVLVGFKRGEWEDHFGK